MELQSNSIEIGKLVRYYQHGIKHYEAEQRIYNKRKFNDFQSVLSRFESYLITIQ